ncbi:gluconate transporter [Niastella yeongjuensis]|uniref:Gluconate transporter n=1 Tax=Niastella yeongjuensis TaxID=354355 RepID=A0A1V9EJR3_9BACT|nr:gluconate:H+ symporter [Niastella yeongjuensis]OQP46115.1 gluconate transporter [Niastella yeongjuensis]SEP17134.1 Gnt-I system high-affinity gluconate transporter [Niastella yeongjuensis]
MSILIVLLCIVILILLITWGKLNAFLAFLIISILAGLLLKLPAEKIMSAVQQGIGDTLGSLVSIICLGAMLGKLVAESGAAQKIATVLMDAFGARYLQWALMITGFIIGIPLFYGVGFVLMVPLIFSVVYQYKLPAVYIGLPMLAALSVTHGFLPPHPSPTALVTQFGASMGITLLYGLLIAIPAIIIAGPLFSRMVKHVKSAPLELFKPQATDKTQLPGTANSFITSLLPVFLLTATTVLSYFSRNNPSIKGVVTLISEPGLIMLISVLVAAFTLGISGGRSMKSVMAVYGDAVKDVGMILLIIAGSGALKQVLTDSGVSKQIASALETWPVHPLVLAWCMAGIIRICVGSATVAGLTTAGIIAPLLANSSVNANLMVLSVGAGSLLFSHVNDAGFWLFKEYFNLSIKDTLKTWSVMETIVAVTGLVGVMILNSIVA